MALVTWATKKVSGWVPKVISPKTHAAIDYAVAGATLVTAGLMWNRNRRAAIGLLGVGAAEVATAAMTDYPGGLFKVLDLQTHRRLDMGQSGMIASMPRLLGIQESDAAKLFTVESAVAAVVTALTDFSRRAERESRQAA